MVLDPKCKAKYKGLCVKCLRFDKCFRGVRTDRRVRLK